MAEDLKLTQGEMVGIVAARAGIMQAQAVLLQAQRDLEAAESRYKGAILQMGYARGLTDGRVHISADGTQLVVR